MNLFKNLFIFEMANNHQGNLQHGLKIIKEMGNVAKKYKINAAIKFQYRDLDSLVHPDYQDRNDVKHIPRFLSTRLEEEDYRKLAEAVRNEGMITITTPFDEPSVEMAIDHNIEIIKVASCSCSDWPLIETIAETQKPVICSSGGSSIHEIDNLVSFFMHREIELALMHCVGVYPSSNEILHMNFVSKMIKRYPSTLVGWSGHEEPDNTDPIKIAVAKGAMLFERHVGLPTNEIKLNSYSMNPQEVEKWIEAALTSKSICGDNDEKVITENELESLLSLQRGVFANKPIKKGNEIKKEDIFFAMPCAENQLTSGEFGQKRTKYIATREYNLNEIIVEKPQTDKISSVRNIIHDAKGMIYEAGIILGSDFDIELSHHYGMENFRETGVILVNIINRQYCKKLLIQLSGQKHPTHLHKIKEETFQLLYGDLTVNIDNKEIQMFPGDKMLVEPNTWHSFRTQGGAIFEEISTRYLRDDSYYKDTAISRLDPMERKTVIDNW